MGFHKRYINDDQVINIYQKLGCAGVIDWYARGADAIITSGNLARSVNDLMKILPHNKSRAWNRISNLISNASIKKELSNIYNKEEYE